MSLEIAALHHVALPVTDLDRAKRFYGDVLGLQEIPRPAFPFPGAWYQVADGHIHLIVEAGQTFRLGKTVNSRDGHAAIRVTSVRRALEHLQSKGYRAGHDDPLFALRITPDGLAGFPQIHLMDPDRNVIEINAERED